MGIDELSRFEFADQQNGEDAPVVDGPAHPGRPRIEQLREQTPSMNELHAFDDGDGKERPVDLEEGKAEPSQGFGKDQAGVTGESEDEVYREGMRKDVGRIGEGIGPEQDQREGDEMEGDERSNHAAVFRQDRMPAEEAQEQIDRQDNPLIHAVASSMAGQRQPLIAQPVLIDPISPLSATLREVPVKDIVLNRHNARKLPPTAAELEKLSVSMRKQQRTPAAGYVDKHGQICLIDGHRRLAAAKNAGLPTLRVELQPEPKTDRELYLASRAYNVEREPQSVLDDAFSWRQMLDQGVYQSQAEIGRDLGIDEADVSRIMNLTTFTPRIIDLLNGQHRLLNLRMLGALRQHFSECGEDATKALIISAEDGGLSSRDVDKLRKAFNKDKISRTRSDTKSTLAFGQARATLKQFDATRKLTIEIVDVDQNIALDLLSEKLKLAITAVLGQARTLD